MAAPRRLFAAALAWQSRMVLRRHLLVYLRNWYTGLLPPAAEPVVLLIAFGLGLGAHVGGMAYGAEPVSYASYIAPGMIAYTAFLTPFFQGLYAAYIRMHYQKTWEGQLTTQVALPHVVWGELLWAALLGTIYCAIVSAVIAACDALGLLEVRAALLPAALPLVFLGGVAFAAVGLLFTATLASIDHMNLPVFLIALPLSFVSNTYFPLPEEPAVVGVLVALNPLYHLAEAVRALLLAGPGALGHALAMLALCGALIAVLVPVVHRKLRRRVLGE